MNVRRSFVRTALQAAIPAVAGVFAGYLDGYGNPENAVSPEELARAIEQNRNIMVDALALLDPMEIAKIRTTYRWLAAEFRSLQTDGQGKWYPYKQVLRAYPLAKHREHLAIVEQHRQWFETQLLEALDWLFGKPPE